MGVVWVWVRMCDYGCVCMWKEKKETERVKYTNRESKTKSVMVVYHLQINLMQLQQGICSIKSETLYQDQEANFIFSALITNRKCTFNELEQKMGKFLFEVNESLTIIVPNIRSNHVRWYQALNDVESESESTVTSYYYFFNRDPPEIREWKRPKIGERDPA